jgi:hypothetical protein
MLSYILQGIILGTVFICLDKINTIQEQFPTIERRKLLNIFKRLWFNIRHR